jgi:hypothetical protein
MRVTSISTPDAPVRTYTRIGKFVTKEERQAAAEKNRLRIVGKWNIPRLEHATKQSAVFEFTADGTVKAAFTLFDQGKIQAFAGTWKALEGKDDTLKIQLTGIDDLDKMGFESIAEQTMKTYFYSSGFTGVLLSADRVQ